MRIQKGNPTTLSVTFYNDDDAVDVGAVTVTAKNLSGETVATGTATSDDAGTYTFPLAAQTDLGPLSVSWTSDTRNENTTVEVVGGHLFSIQEARASDEVMAVGSRRNYSAADIKAARDGVETEFERITGRSFTPRRSKATVENRNGSGFLPVMDVTRVISVDGEPFTGTFSRIGRVDGLAGNAVEVVFEYGLDTVPDDVKSVGLLRTRYNLAASNTNVPDRATSMTVEGNTTYTLATPGRAGSETGIPQVDATLSRYSVRKASAVV